MEEEEEAAEVDAVKVDFEARQRAVVGLDSEVVARSVFFFYFVEEAVVEEEEVPLNHDPARRAASVYHPVAEEAAVEREEEDVEEEEEAVAFVFFFYFDKAAVQEVEAAAVEYKEEVRPPNPACRVASVYHPVAVEAVEKEVVAVEVTAAVVEEIRLNPARQAASVDHPEEGEEAAVDRRRRRRRRRRCLSSEPI